MRHNETKKETPFVPWERILQSMSELSRATRFQHYNEPLALLGFVYCLRRDHGNLEPPLVDIDHFFAWLSHQMEERRGGIEISVIDYLFPNLNQLESGIGSGWLKLALGEWPLNGFAEWFHTKLYQLKIGWYHGTPPSVDRVISSLFSGTNFATIYDPACGTGGLLHAIAVERGKSTLLFGQEEIGEVWAWAKLRFWVSDLDADLRSGNTLKNDAFREFERTRLFDLVVSNPPFGAQIAFRDISPWTHYSALMGDLPNRVSSEVAYVNKIYDSLRDGGIAAIIVPNGLLFRAGLDERLRESLIKRDAIEAVIGLPARLFAPSTAIEAAILVLNKRKADQRRDHVLFLDARDLGQRDSARVALPDAAIEQISTAYREWKTEQGFSEVVALQDLTAEAFSLSPSRYVQPAPTQTTVSFSDRRILINELDQRCADLQQEYETLRIKLVSWKGEADTM
ncbi:N-6 DNA methylase [Rhizobium miluonense]|uniref:site-specific DNA-methyltransferase (adenine-specific) n=1 Tax=Rhizobium miluonense TaxID=411945 RepID=A0A1C3XDZ8_9HYPH|nr:N-6 DNA methylase [Rhizobium miluonense]SCB50517.1 N-6 DNA Methylase [Rhizobium miluonense]